MRIKSLIGALTAMVLAITPAYGAFTPNKSYNLQATGSNINTWGIVLNSNFSSIDSSLGGRLNNNVAGNSNITVSSSQAQNLIHVLSGVLTGNINYIFPPSGGMYYVVNNTTGAFTVTATISGGSGGVAVPQGATALVFANPDVPNVSSLSSQATQFFVGGTTTGSSNAQVLATVSPSGYSLTQGYLTTWRAGFSNNGAMTLNQAGLGVLSLKKTTPTGLQNTVNGDVIQNGDYASVYDATANAMVLLNPTSGTFGTVAPLNYDGTNFTASGGNLAFGSAPVLPSTTTATTQTSSDNSTKVATDAFVQTAVSTISGYVKKVNIQQFTSSGTYTPCTGLLYDTVEVQAPGGGGGSGSGVAFGSSGGGAGGYAKLNVSAATVGASQSVTVGSPGSSASGGGGGGAGGTTSFGSILSCGGGLGGLNGNNATGGTGGVCNTGSPNVTGGTGQPGYNANFSGAGANSFYGTGGPMVGSISGTTGSDGVGYGAGGSGSYNNNTSGNGAPGVVIITEYCSQ